MTQSAECLPNTRSSGLELAAVGHAPRPSTWKAEAGESEFEVSLVYGVSSRVSRATQDNPVLKMKKQNRKVS